MNSVDLPPLGVPMFELVFWAPQALAT
jgi:hypothetical protein